MTKGTFAMSLALAMACGVAQAQTAERSGLKWSLKEGETLHYAISTASETALRIGEAMTLTDSNTLSTYTVSQTVKSVGEDGTAVVEAKVTSVKIDNVMKSPMGAQKMTYDSTTDGGDPMLRVMRHAVSKTFTFKISSLGKVTGVEGGAEIRSAIAKAAEEELAQAMGGMGGGGMGGGGMGGGGMGGMGGNPAMAARMAAEQLTAIFADEVIESTLTSLYNVLPEGAKVEGESWTSPSKIEQPFLGAIEYTTKYTHGGSVGEQARIKISMDGEFKVSAPEPGAGGAGGRQAGMMQMVKQMMKDLKVKTATVDGAATFGKGKLSDSELNRSIEAEGPLHPMLAMQFGGGQGGGDEPQMTLSSKTKLRCEIQDAAPAGKAPAEGEKGTEGKDRSF